MIQKLIKKLGISSDRTKNIVQHVGWSTLYKSGSVVAGFVLVPLAINYLDEENYGIWLTLSSFIAWFSFFDIGLGHGLRNKFAEAKANNQIKLARSYISSAYYTIGIINLFLIPLFLVVNKFINWSSVFNTSLALEEDLRLLMPIILSFFGLQLVVKLIVSIYAADQHHSIQSKIDFLTRAISVLAVWGLTKMEESSLLLFGTIFSAIPFLVLLYFNFIAFSGKYKAFKPALKLFNKGSLMDISGIGIGFFFIQISLLVLFSTDNFIISKLYSPAEVVPYTIAHKYFSIVIMAYTIIAAPYWSSFTEAYTRKDFQWIKHSIKSIQKLWLLVPIILLIMILAANWFYKIWVGNEVEVPFSLTIGMAIFVLLMTFQTIYVLFLNGVGKIRLQIYISIFSIVVNIPLSIFLSKTLDLGLAGIILATCFSLLISIVLWPLQYYKIINNKATGIWNK